MQFTKGPETFLVSWLHGEFSDISEMHAISLNQANVAQRDPSVHRLRADPLVSCLWNLCRMLINRDRQSSLCHQ